ncbi:MAG: hypothetical protein K9W43_04965 [Candidatus Thorarchaeota archaeon]|nr:hypothetical protein [Candidatus Thorarchaeota archaeon]
MPEFIDAIGSGENDTYALILRASVTDPDGVDEVIGSYCNRSENVWHNVTMQLDLEQSAEDISVPVYVAVALNYTLTNTNSGVIWDVKIYARDSLGHWSVNTTFQSVNRLWSSNPTSITISATDWIVGICVIISVVVIIGVIIKSKTFPAEYR